MYKQSNNYLHVCGYAFCSLKNCYEGRQENSEQGLHCDPFVFLHQPFCSSVCPGLLSLVTFLRVEGTCSSGGPSSEKTLSQSLYQGLCYGMQSRWSLCLCNLLILKTPSICYRSIYKTPFTCFMFLHCDLWNCTLLPRHRDSLWVDSFTMWVLGSKSGH